MIRVLITTVILISHSVTSFANPAIEKTINEVHWQKRIILLFDDEQHSPQKQLQQWQKVDFDEWDIVTIQVSADDAQLRQKHQVHENKTISILIGKDGTEKWRSSRLVDFSILEKLIEKMPMQRNESNL